MKTRAWTIDDVRRQLGNHAENLKHDKNVCLTGKSSRVYFLIKNRRVVYIGQTTAVWPQRICGHVDEGEKDFDDFYSIVVEPHRLNEVESWWISTCKPIYNGKPNAGYLAMIRTKQRVAIEAFRESISKAS